MRLSRLRHGVSRTPLLYHPRIQLEYAEEA
jgi:hypothetical protein